MARVRGGNTGFAVALVIFGCGFVISLLVAIIFYTKIEEHKAAEIAAEETLADFISSGETVQANDFKSNTATVFTNMLVQIRDLQADKREADDQVSKLDREKREMEAQYATLDGLKKALEENNKVEAQRYIETMEERKLAVDKALRENAELASKIAEMQTKLNASLEDADAAARNRIAELTEQLKAIEDEKVVVDGEAANWEKMYKQLLASLPKPPPVGTTNPDGEVASVFGQGNDLFIDLGRRDGIVMGMTFEIYDPQPIIRLSTTDEARGKATIEVYGLQDNAATCRVVRRDRGAAINPGDPIVNVAYDPNMTIKMFAFGDFDIEGDGGTNDIGRIEAIIKESGAELVGVSKTDAGIPILTPDIIYIVLGAKPELPDKPSADVFDPVIIAEYQAKLAANEAYFRIVDEAKIMRIPVLSQDRFLDLVGYYER
jgi:archaellum biogenesis ATPase FlaH